MSQDKRQQSPPDATRTSHVSSSTLRSGQMLAGRYRIENVIGVGAMGTVYRALDTRLDVFIALKVLHTSVAKNADAVRRFETELTLARQVTHANVVRIHDIGEHEDLSFLTMDLISGQSLAEIIDNEGKLPADRAANIARDIAAGLAEAHAKGVVHRDLKPGNILIDHDGNALITDFGVALSIASARVTRTGFFIGTPQYLAPEQARGDTVDGRADIYALGLILYEMLAGKQPFDSASMDELIAQRTHGRLPALTREALAAPEYLRRIIGRCLRKNPGERYQDAAALATDLASGTAPRGRSRWWLRGAAILASVAVGAWASLTLMKPQQQAIVESAVPGPAMTLAILPFRDEPADPALAWISTGVLESLAAELAVSEQLNIVDKQRVLTTLADLRIPAGQPSPEVARQLATLFGADWVVGGTLNTDGGRVEVDATMLSGDAATRDRRLAPVSAQFVDVADLGSAIASEIRRSLSLPKPAKAPMRLSGNLDALRAYATGVDQLAKGDSIGALERLEAAVQADAGFAAAWLKLAEAYDAMGRDKDATDAVDRAVSEIGETDDRIAEMARVRQAELTGKLDTARELLTRIVEREPGDSSARLMLAELTGNNGHYSQAIELLEALVKDDPNHPRAWFLLGKFAIQNGDSQRALGEYLPNALDIQEKLENVQGKADVLNAMGIAQHRVGNLADAKTSYAQAAELRGAVGDDRGLASSLANLARIELQLGRYDQARASLDRAIAVRTRLGDQSGLAGLHNIYGVLEEEQGDYQAALRRYRRALTIREDMGDQHALGNSYNNIGFAYFVLGEYDNAGVYWHQALEQSVATDNPDVQMRARQNLGQLKLAQGEWAESLDLFLKSLEFSRKIGYPDAEAVALGNLGRVAQRQGRFEAALSSYAEALGILKQMGDTRGMVEFTLWRADTWLELGRDLPAAADLDAAEALLAQVSNDGQLANLEVSRGSLAARRGDSSVAGHAFDAAIAASERSGSSILALSVLVARAESSRPGSINDLDNLTQRAVETGNADLAMRALSVMVRERLAQGDATGALSNLNALLTRLNAHSPYSRAWHIQLLSSDVYAANQRGEQAAAAIAQAVKEISRLVANMPESERQAFQSQPPVARALAQ